jgi:chorismate mutase
MSDDKTFKALRGAICSSNDREEIAARVPELFDALLEANGLAEKDLVSLFFSVTPDLDALNPAAALRKSGRAGELAMMVFQEAVIQNGPSGVIRLLLHCNINSERPLKHIYLKGAEALRPDWAGKTPL